MQSVPAPFLPPELVQGVAQFNRGEYFECHETLEGLWRRQRGPKREVYQGIIQVAVALHHLRNGNDRGAVAMLEKALPKLERGRRIRTGVDVARLLEEVGRLKERLEERGSQGVGRFDRCEAPRIVFIRHR